MFSFRMSVFRQATSFNLIRIVTGELNKKTNFASRNDKMLIQKTIIKLKNARRQTAEITAYCFMLRMPK